MDEATRALIRRLYFVEQHPMRSIGEALSLAPRAVRSALVLPGGRRDEREPGPVADALAPPTTPPTHHRVREGRR